MKQLLIIISSFVTISCGGGAEIRKPVEVKQSSFLKESAKKNRKLVEVQHNLIEEAMRADSLKNYQTSSDGIVYYYINKNPQAKNTPVFGDLVEYTFGIYNLNGAPYYPKEENRIHSYHIDKEELFQGLRLALKTLKVGEEAVFFLPSEMAFGYRGNEDKIPINQPIKLQVHLLKHIPSIDVEKKQNKENNSQNQQ